MVIDLRSGEVGAEIQTGICIIGGGVAGQTLAMRLARNGHDALIVESGGRDFDADTQTLSGGENVGEPYYDLVDSRLRLFGGTAAIWGGRCAELDAIDFTRRDYIPHSGWPITKTDLDPYYDRAYAALGLKRYPGHPSTIDPTSSLDPDKIVTGYWSFDEDGERFTNVSRGNLDEVKILLHATVSALDVDDSGTVRALRAQSLNGKQVRVLAPVFVLAAGAIETIRLLLAAIPARPNGLGNSKDQLGRFFMEHPHARGGEIVSSNLAQSLKAIPRGLRSGGARYAAFLRPSDRVQRETGILNSSISLAPRRHEGDAPDLVRALKQKLKHDLPSTRFWRSTYKGLKQASVSARALADPWASVFSVKRPGSKLGLYAVVRAEQAPNPDSRITLGTETDKTGLPFAEFDWQFSDIDKRSVAVLMSTLKAEYERLGWGEVRPAAWLGDDSTPWHFDPLISSHPIGGYHHMGGTRMAETPQTGVVDANCRAFESPNLYVASSSVFPTGGWANPTLTIMALAERLGDYIHETS